VNIDLRLHPREEFLCDLAGDTIDIRKWLGGAGLRTADLDAPR
jgi:hypothetical protein